MAFTSMALLSSGLLLALSNNSITDEEEQENVFNNMKTKLDNIKFNTNGSMSLLSECNFIINSLQHIPHRRLNSERAHYLIDMIENCIYWCDKYDKKSGLNKYINKNRYEYKFERLKNNLSQAYLFLILDLFIMVAYDKQKDSTISDRSPLYTPIDNDFFNKKDSPLNNSTDSPRQLCSSTDNHVHIIG